jgi:hypothetical protein
MRVALADAEPTARRQLAGLLADLRQVVTRAALAGALDDYMKFANIREMHRLSAVGVAEAAAVDDKGLYVAARIDDPAAWEKVREGVYKGYSIGGRVTARDPADRHVITGLALTEISLVDRPANPEAVFDCWKSKGGEDMAEPGTAAGELVAKAAQSLAETAARLERSLAFLTGGGLAKALAGDVLPRLDALAKRVEEIAATPLPPQTFARGLAAIEKHEDGGGAASPDAVVAALARMSEEERTLALIKAAHANPVRPARFPMR